MSKRRVILVISLVSASFLLGMAFAFRQSFGQGEGLMPAARAQSEQPISMGELETTSVPVTIPRPLEVPEVYAFERSLDPATTQVIIVDSKKSRICVYHIGQDGSIEFVANRNYTWDMTLDVYNEKGLTPSQIREYYETNSVGK